MAGEAAGPRCLREEVLGGANTILRYAVYLNGKYDMMGLFVTVPLKLRRGSIEQVVGIKFTPEEQAAFDKFVGAVRELVENLKP